MDISLAPASSLKNSLPAKLLALLFGAFITFEMVGTKDGEIVHNEVGTVGTPVVFTLDDAGERYLLEVVSAKKRLNLLLQDSSGETVASLRRRARERTHLLAFTPEASGQFTLTTTDNGRSLGSDELEITVFANDGRILTPLFQRFFR